MLQTLSEPTSVSTRVVLGVVIGEGECEGEPVAVEGVAGDMVGLVDVAGQPIPGPKRPAREDVGVTSVQVVVLASLLDGVDEAAWGRVDQVGRPIPRPKRPLHEDVDVVGGVVVLTGRLDGVREEVAGSLESVDEAAWVASTLKPGQPIPRLKRPGRWRGERCDCTGRLVRRRRA